MNGYCAAGPLLRSSTLPLPLTGYQCGRAARAAAISDRNRLGGAETVADVPYRFDEPMRGPVDL